MTDEEETPRDEQFGVLLELDQRVRRECVTFLSRLDSDLYLHCGAVVPAEVASLKDVVLSRATRPLKTVVERAKALLAALNVRAPRQVPPTENLEAAIAEYDRRVAHERGEPLQDDTPRMTDEEAKKELAAMNKIWKAVQELPTDSARGALEWALAVLERKTAL